MAAEEDSTNLPLGYVPVEVFLEKLTRRPASLDALLAMMKYPGMPGSVRGLSIEEKVK